MFGLTYLKLWEFETVLKTQRENLDTCRYLDRL